MILEELREKAKMTLEELREKESVYEAEFIGFRQFIIDVFSGQIVSEMTVKTFYVHDFNGENRRIRHVGVSRTVYSWDYEVYGLPGQVGHVPRRCECLSELLEVLETYFGI